jgi:DNA modification methylase
MNIEKIQIDKLKAATYNPRQISTKQYKDLKESINKFGLVDPIIVNKCYTIIGGHQRYKICKDLDYKDIGCIILDLDKEQERELNIRLNKNTGDFDMDILANEFDIDQLVDWGFKHIDLDINIDKITEGNTEDDHIPEVKESRVKLGDVWQLGKHRLMCGDSTKESDVEKLMNGEKADMVFTDPPYDLDNDNWLDICIKKNKDAELIILGSDKQTIRYCSAYNDMFKNFYIIHYKQFNWNLSKYTPILTHIVVSHLRNKDKKHIDLKGLHSLLEFPSIRDYTIMSHSKRLECILPFINIFSTKLVLDVFLGSGSTLIACEKTNRICYGMELDTKYCDVIIERWEQFTGQKATKL